jgi:hypothetical protein
MPQPQKFDQEQNCSQKFKTFDFKIGNIFYQPIEISFQALYST